MNNNSINKKSTDNYIKKNQQIVVIIAIILTIVILYFIFSNYQQGEYQITTKESASLLGGKTYYATKIISFDKTSVRFVEKGPGEEKFITAEEIEIKKTK